MHDMSNTGKEIAARLGFAAMGPAPLKGSPARKAEIAQDKAAAAVRKKALLVKKNVAVLKRIESDYNDALSGMRELAAALTKKLAQIKSRTVNGDVDAEEYSSIFDEAATGIGQSIEVLNDYNFARSGAKAEFGFGPAPLRGSPARKEEIAQEKAAAAARAAARAAAIDEEKATIQRKLNTLLPRYRELADYVIAASPRIYKLNTETYRTPDMKKKAKLLRLLDKERAVYRESQIAVKQTSTEILELQKRARKLGMTLQASRPGAKDAFAMKVDMPELRAEFLGFDVDSNGNKIARFKKYSGETVRIQTNGNLPKSHRMTNQSLDAKAIEQEVLSSSYASKFALKPRSSRPGAKTRMTRDQTEEQKAGLKIMSAADPAVGAKIATLIKEGKPQDQAVAIALDMKRRGEL